MRLAAIALIAGMDFGCSSAAEDPDRSSTMTILAASGNCAAHSFTHLSNDDFEMST